MDEGREKMSMTGVEKSAVMLMTLGEERAAEVLKCITPAEVPKIIMAMSKIGPVPQNQLVEILVEFESESEKYATLNVNTREYVRSVLIKAMGEERANTLLEDLLGSYQVSGGMEALNRMDAGTAADLIRDEHPQIIATILAHLKRNQAVDILELFDAGLRNDVVLRIATLGGIQPSALAELTEVLNNMLSGQNPKRNKIGGVRTAAEIVNLMKSQQEEDVMNAVRGYDDELAQKIIDQMFLFENFSSVEDASIRRLLQDIDPETLLVAMKGANDELREKFLKNMSRRAGELLREDLEARGPMRMADVEAAQKSILETSRKLVESGDIIIGGAEEDYV
jgi:flagellar motor switch protein FliG